MAKTVKKGETGSKAPAPAVPWTLTLVSDCGVNTGDQTAITRTPSGAAFVTLSDAGSTSDCTLPAEPTVQVKNYAVCYGETASGTAATASNVITQSYVALNGVGIAASAAGEVTIAYPGGPISMKRCGSSDLDAIKKPAGGSFGMAATIQADSQANNPSTGPQKDDCVQGVCNKGAATGFWPAVTYVGNNPVYAFRDIHFGFAGDDFEKSDLEYSHGGTTDTLDVSKGAGDYSHIGTTKDGMVTIVNYNGEGTQVYNGIWALRQSAAGFDRQQITTLRVGEGIGFDIASNDLQGVAFYDPEAKRLKYMETPDGITWTEPEDADTDGDTGRYPSLVYDANNEPAIAHYRCNDYSSTASGCDQSADGLFLSRRVQGAWQTTKIVAEGSINEGLYTAITTIGGKILIAYQKLTFDPSNGSTKRELYLAKEP